MDDKELRRIKTNERIRNWKRKNPDKVKLQRKLYKLKNKDKIKQYECNNREKINATKERRRLKYKEINRLFIYNYKSNKTCVNCTENRPECLDFHHIRDKNIKISKMCSLGYNLQLLKDEIDKCILLCRNCHAKEHFKGYKTLTKKEQFVIEYKSKHPCYFCTESIPYCLEFHHLNPNTKINSIAQMGHKKQYTIEDVKIEMEKCIILCRKCHKLLHNNILILPVDIQPIKLL